jgi:hypothetical protein
MAIHVTRIQKEQTANNKNIQEQVYKYFRWFYIIQGIHKFNDKTKQNKLRGP